MIGVLNQFDVIRHRRISRETKTEHFLHTIDPERGREKTASEGILI
jgi:hypothetical protein